MSEQFSVVELAKAEINRGFKRFTEPLVKLFRNLLEIVDRYVEGRPKYTLEREERLYQSKAPYIMAAFIASIGLLFPLCSSLGVFEVPVQFLLYVPLAALVLAALITILASLK